jgi:hypothetical protein
MSLTRLGVAHLSRFAGSICLRPGGRRTYPLVRTVGLASAFKFGLFQTAHSSLCSRWYFGLHGSIRCACTTEKKLADALSVRFLQVAQFRLHPQRKSAIRPWCGARRKLAPTQIIREGTVPMRTDQTTTCLSRHSQQPKPCKREEPPKRHFRR